MPELLKFESVTGEIANPCDFTLTGVAVINKVLHGVHRNAAGDVIAPFTITDITTNEVPYLWIGSNKLNIIRNSLELDAVV